MKKLISLVLMITICCTSIVSTPIIVQSEDFLTEDIAWQFVDIFCDVPAESEEAIVDVLTGKSGGTPEIIKTIIESGIKIYGVVDESELVSEYVQLYYSSQFEEIGTILNLATAALDVFENVHSMLNSDIALQKSVDALQIVESLLGIIGYAPTSLGMALLAVEVAIDVGGILQDAALKEYVNMYELHLQTACYTGEEMKSPIGYITVTVNFKWSQEEVDAMCSQLYMYYRMKQILEDLSYGSGSSTPSTYTIIYNSNCSDVSNIQKTYASSETVSLPTLERENYVFMGWYYEPECINAVEGENPKCDQTFYARWEQRYTTITYVSNCDEVENVTYKYDVLADEWTYPSMKRKCYTLEGWYYDAECTHKVTSFSRYQDQVFYAKWQSVFYYSISEDEAAITGIRTFDVYGDGTDMTDLIVPEYIDSYKVTAINNLSSSKFKSIRLPDSITNINDNAFSSCSSLESVNIPDSVTRIGTSAFYNCIRLKEITIPKNVTSIGERVFSNCSSLTSIDVDSDNPKFCSDDGVLFDINKTNLWKYPSKKSGTEYVIPDTVKNIRRRAFDRCSQLESICMPKNIDTIYTEAFAFCTALENIYVTGENIFPNAFLSCKKLESVKLSDNVKVLYNYVFQGCTSLEEITIPETVTSIGDNVFQRCTNLSSIYYTSDKSEWEGISISETNAELYNATVHFNQTVEYDVHYTYSNKNLVVNVSVEGNTSNKLDGVLVAAVYDLDNNMKGASLKNVLISGYNTTVADFVIGDYQYNSGDYVVLYLIKDVENIEPLSNFYMDDLTF